MNTVFFKGNQLEATPHISVIIDRVIALYTLTSASIFSILFSLLVGTDRENLLNNQSFVGWESFSLFS